MSVTKVGLSLFLSFFSFSNTLLYSIDGELWWPPSSLLYRMSGRQWVWKTWSAWTAKENPALNNSCSFWQWKMESRSVPWKGISGATGSVNGGLLQAMLWDVYEGKVGVLYKKIKTFARGRWAHLQLSFLGAKTVSCGAHRADNCKDCPMVGPLTL